MKINDFFEKGYYINLNKRTERKECFLNDMKKVGLESFFERIPAFYHGDKTDFDYKTTHQACARSLLFTIQKAYDLQYNNVLIFEDDAYFLENGLEYVESSLDSLSKINDWDLIYFGGMLLDAELNLVSKNLLKQNSLLTCHAIGYNRSGMEKMLRCKWYEGGGAAIDGWMANEVDPERFDKPKDHPQWLPGSYFKKYVTYPLAVVQYEHRPSDLSGDGYNGLSAGFDDYARGYINKPINYLNIEYQNNKLLKRSEIEVGQEIIIKRKGHAEIAGVVVSVIQSKKFTDVVLKSDEKEQIIRVRDKAIIKGKL